MSDTEERWLPVVGHEGAYEVSDLGRVRSVERWVRRRRNTVLLRLQVLSPGVGKYGHLRITLFRDGCRFQNSVHRLVLTAFVGPAPDGHQACHNPDPDPANNRLQNLTWGTTQDNHDQMTAHGRRAIRANHGRAKLTETQVREIKARLSVGFWGVKVIAVLAKEYGVTSSAIQGIKNGRNWGGT